MAGQNPFRIVSCVSFDVIRKSGPVTAEAKSPDCWQSASLGHVGGSQRPHTGVIYRVLGSAEGRYGYGRSVQQKSSGSFVILLTKFIIYIYICSIYLLYNALLNICIYRVIKNSQINLTIICEKVKIKHFSLNI